MASHTIAKSADGCLSVEYERFAHKTAVTHFIVRVSPSMAEQVLVR